MVLLRVSFRASHAGSGGRIRVHLAGYSEKMSPEPLKSSFANLKQDILASVVVFLVALPLCMGFAIASGAPPAAGLITGIIGGIVAGSLSGCPLQVSGPAAGLAVIVYELIQKFGFAALGPIIVLAGLLQIVSGFLRA